MNLPRVFASIAFVLLAVTNASADGPASATPDASASETQAHAHFQQGKAFLDAKVYDQAVKEFQAAYALSPLPELLFDLGQAYRLSGQAQLALDTYQKYLAVVTDGPLADEARVHVAEMTKQAGAEAAQRQVALDAEHAQRQAALSVEQASWQTRHDEVATARHAAMGAFIVSALVIPVGIYGVRNGCSGCAMGGPSLGFIFGVIGIAFGGIGVIVGGSIYAYEVSQDPGPAPIALPAPAGTAPAMRALSWGWRF